MSNQSLTPVRTRAEHLKWARERALEYVAAGNLPAALDSLTSDLGKHPATRQHDAVEFSVMLRVGGKLKTAEEVRAFIEEVQ